MNVLVACEESQTVCKAFLELGHNAYSCDMQKCSGGRPDRQIVGNCLPIVYMSVPSFMCEDGSTVVMPYWHLMIAHPPCTYLSKVSAPEFVRNPDPSILQSDAREFFRLLYECSIPHRVIENPLPLKSSGLPSGGILINPSQFGSIYSKGTVLWYINVPPLVGTCYCLNPISTVNSKWYNIGSGSSRSRNRSKFFPEVAAAMANQWSDLLSYGYE